MLINEVLAKYEEQRRSRTLATRSAGSFQLSFLFADRHVILDVGRLLLIYAEQNQGISGDYPKMETFVKEFLTGFFGLDAAVVEERMRLPTSNTDDNKDKDGPAAADDEDAGPPSPVRTNGRERQVRATGRTRDDSNGSGPNSRTPTMSGQDEEMPDAAPGSPPVAAPAPETTGNRKWLSIADGRDQTPNWRHARDAFERGTYYMYCNATLYTFFRMFALLYERLAGLKKHEKETRRQVLRAGDLTKPAVEMGMIDRMPSEFFSRVDPKANYYRQTLKAFEAMVMGEAEPANMEELLRRYYLHAGWLLYGLDKLLAAMSRFALAVVSSEAKDRSLELFALFKKDRTRTRTTFDEQMVVRRQAEALIKEGDMFRIAYVSDGFDAV